MSTKQAPQGQFERRPGTGYMFLRTTQDDVRGKKDKTDHMFAVWSGHLTFPDNPARTYQVRMVASSRTGKCELSLHEFPENVESDEDKWKEVGKFTMPTFKGFAYVDSTVTDPVTGREYDVRAIAPTEENAFIMLRLPRVMSAKTARAAAF